MMKTLYLVNNPKLIEQCQAAMSSQDAVLLIEDAVTIATQPCSAGVDGFVLDEDLIARGLESVQGWSRTDYVGFVSLTLKFDKVVSWL